jgi:penicillin amidase
MKRLTLWPILAGLWLFALARPWGPLPAIGPLFDLHAGVWAHHEFTWRDAQLPGLKNDVQIAIDASGVPHFFAQSEEDLYRAQGYVMASQRLFQMDLSSRSTSGELSELVGAKGLDMDRFFVRFGMRQSILKTVNEYMAHEQTAMMINAFTDGVNSYISTLEELPIEYKLLNKRPQHFSASRVIQMAKTLTYSLNGRSSDYVLSHLQQEIGTEKVLDLFPEFLPDEFADFIMSRSWAPKARAPETASLFTFQTHLKNFPDIPQPTAGNGSNNWAVGPAKSTTGHSILANDTHLGLTLPNIWFENQLSCPAFNVYGVSLVDVPGIINGFTAHTAWGPTNGSTDALDYYEVEFTGDDSMDYKDGETVRTAQVFHELVLSGTSSETVDAVWTKWGPVLYREGRYGLIANWTGHTTRNELLALRNLYDSKTVKDCVAAFRDWHVPIQNFVCADADHIGMIHAGFIPRREIGEGRFIAPAGKATLAQAIPEEFRPVAIDPKEGYVRSANERVVNRTFPFYMGWDYEEPWRGMQIKKLLEQKQKLSGEDLIAIQNDDFDPQASFILPLLLKNVQRDSLNPVQREWVAKLEKWNLHDVFDSIEPAIYKAWYRELKADIFSDEYDVPERKYFVPRDARVAWMLKRVTENPDDSDAQWIDDKKTPEKETLPSLVTRAFKEAWASLEKENGNVENWTWKNYIQTKIPHVAEIPGFGSGLLSMSGSASSVRGNNGRHGAVYKFVIELGPALQAWIQVPGGLSGDPLSPRFEKDVEPWSQGVMRKVEFYKDLNEARQKAVQVIELKAGKI